MPIFFIHRSIFAIVIAINHHDFRFAGDFFLPIAQYPKITQPTVSGSYNLKVVFDLDTNSDMDAILVQNSVSVATVALPADVKNVGVTTKRASGDMAYLFRSTLRTALSIEHLFPITQMFMMLVIIIVFIFLQSLRATLIPVPAIPVSLVGTFTTFILLGFTINTLTLFTIVLAIGLVVDDAIVVIENVEYHMKHDALNPVEATERAMDEVQEPVVAIALVLSAVFIPVAFLGGITSVLYKQFALTIAVSMILSAFIALTLTPALCALLMKPHNPDAKKNFLDKLFDKFNN